jgi:hypothetical protein
VAGDRVRGEAAQVNSERDIARLDREVRVDPMEGALVGSVSVVLTRRRAQQAWHGAPSRRGLEPAPLGDVARQRASEVGSSGRASSADGRRRSAAAGDPPSG